MAEEPVAAAGGLTEEDRRVLLGKDPATGLTEFERRQCRHCLGVHSRACPRVRRIRYTDSGAVSEVEYWPEGRWTDDFIIWPEMLGVLDKPKGAPE